jgi:hypothetical protein
MWHGWVHEVCMAPFLPYAEPVSGEHPVGVARLWATLLEEDRNPPQPWNHAAQAS